MAENAVNKTLLETEVKKKLFLDLVKEIKCSVCQTLPNVGTKSFYRCPKLHFTCDQCFNQSKLCCQADPCNACTMVQIGNPNYQQGYGRYNYNPPTLQRGKVPHALVKCAFTQSFLDQWNLRVCINHKNGCNQVDSEENLREHQGECYYREIKCPHSSCQKKFGLTTIIDHMKHDHFNAQTCVDLDGFGTKMKMSRPFAWPFIGGDIPPKIISIQNLTFFEVWYKREKSMYMWVYFLGDPCEADRFQYHIHLKKASGREVAYFGKVKSINEEFGTILDDENTFTISMEMIQRYSNELNLEYTLKIRNMKEEVKDDKYESGIDDSD